MCVCACAQTGMCLSASVCLYNLDATCMYTSVCSCYPLCIIHGQPEQCVARFPLQLFLVDSISMLCTLMPVQQAPKVNRCEFAILGAQGAPPPRESAARRAHV